MGERQTDLREVGGTEAWSGAQAMSLRCPCPCQGWGRWRRGGEGGMRVEGRGHRAQWVYRLVMDKSGISAEDGVGWGVEGGGGGAGAAAGPDAARAHRGGPPPHAPGAPRPPAHRPPTRPPTYPPLPPTHPSAADPPLSHAPGTPPPPACLPAYPPPPAVSQARRLRRSCRPPVPSLRLRRAVSGGTAVCRTRACGRLRVCSRSATWRSCHVCICVCVCECVRVCVCAVEQLLGGVAMCSARACVCVCVCACACACVCTR